MRPLVKIIAVLAAVVGLAFVFVRSAQNTQAEPYAIDRGLLATWTVAIETAAGATAPMLVLRGPPQLTSALFRQLFSRMAESLNAPADSVIPLVLQGEFEKGIAPRLTPEALVAAARQEGLESAVLPPRCLAHRRESAPGVIRQVYFVLFDSPEFTRFRELIGVRINPAGALPTVFDPAALSPVLIVGASDAGFNRWLPLRADPQIDCVAPLVLR